MANNYIYIIGSDEPPFKIGITNNLDKRLKNLQTGHPKLLKIHEYKEVTSDKVRLLERVIHRHLKMYRTHGEWFDISLENARLELEFALIRYENDPTVAMRLKDHLI